MTVVVGLRVPPSARPDTDEAFIHKKLGGDPRTDPRSAVGLSSAAAPTAPLLARLRRRSAGT